MQQAVERCHHELTAVRTGRASPGLLDSVTVDAYGDKASLQHVATATMRGPRTIGVTVFDKGLTASVVEAIRASPLQLTPRQEGGDILVPVPECAPATHH
jgi:ribosome recycling factor